MSPAAFPRGGGASLRAGYLQLTPRFGDVDGNLERLAAQARRAGGADLLVAPELALTGYLFADRDELRGLAEPAGGASERALCDLAAELDTHLVVGVAERDGRRVYNGAVLVGPDGPVGRYRKVHLFADERDLFAPGDLPFAAWDLGGARVGMMICFDWIFPEAMRTLALRGADVVAHPSNLVLPLCQRVMPTRCIENRLFAVTANRCGGEERAGRALRFTGGSVIVDPAGEVLAEGPPAGDEVRVVTLRPADAWDKMITERNHVLEDRRPAMYER